MKIILNSHWMDKRFVDLPAIQKSRIERKLKSLRRRDLQEETTRWHDAGQTAQHKRNSFWKHMAEVLTPPSAPVHEGSYHHHSISKTGIIYTAVRYSRT